MTISKIEWAGRSDWNPVRGCTRVTPVLTKAAGALLDGVEHKAMPI